MHDSMDVIECALRHVGTMFRVWKAQKEPWVLDEDQSKAFLEETIDVMEQTRVEKTKGSINVSYTPKPPMKRIAFLKVWLIWFAVAVGGLAGTISSTPSDKQVMSAIQHITTTFPTVDAFDNAFLNYAFDSPGNSLDLGWYSFANGASPLFKVRLAIIEYHETLLAFIAHHETPMALIEHHETPLALIEHHETPLALMALMRPHGTHITS
jgi:hypothetical protein